jgi:beta-glucanase (GH16 family)
MKMFDLLILPFLFSMFSWSSGDSPRPIILPAKGPVDQAWEFEKAPSWVDEFDYEGLPDPTKWDYDIGGSGWGNNELQYYTKNLENAQVGEGVLKITVIKEGKEYTSARLVSRKKGDFLYGRFEVKAKLPTGRGTWPAAWMLPTDWVYGDWPRSGEIDIIEHVGYDQDKVHMSVHTQAYNHKVSTQKTSSKTVPGVSEDFHLYRIDWTPYAIRGYVDNVQLFEFINDGKGIDSWPFDQKFHFLLNLAVGGDWGGAQGVDSSIFPQSMEVDYVRVYDMIGKYN